MHATITAAELADRTHGPLAPTLLDIRYRMGGPPGRPVFEGGHIPGARYVDLDAELAGPPGTEGRHPLPAPDVFAAAMRRAGVDDDRDVVVYDDWQGWGAARAWWLLRWAGHGRVRVLDGGLAAWRSAGHSLETGTPPPGRGTFAPDPGHLPVLAAGQAAALARSGLLLDARAAERYRGDVEPIDRVAGHIPGAVSAPTTENVTESGHFRPPEVLRDRFRALGAGASAGAGGAGEVGGVGVYCGSGVSAAHEVLALAIAGIPAALYVGSWSEWSSDGTRPVATGPHPG